jgi:hypothetical protein
VDFNRALRLSIIFTLFRAAFFVIFNIPPVETCNSALASFKYYESHMRAGFTRSAKQSHNFDETRNMEIEAQNVCFENKVLKNSLYKRSPASLS